MREIYIKSKAGLLPIGRRGENLAARVHLAEVPESGQAVTVYVLRNGDTAAYPASEIEITDTEIIWTVTSVDTGKSGRGKVQYKFADSVTGEIVKTEIYGFVVGLAIDTEVGPAPDPYETWLDSLTELAGQTQVYATQAQASAESASESAQDAEQSALSAGTHATNAQTSATTASQKAAQAATSEAFARTYAEQARASAESAGVSATSAAESATAAGGSAESASASAESASWSKTAAEAARQSAYEWAMSSRDYSEAARQSATAASQSETSADESATAASASATSASQSAQTATTKASEASASATTATTKASEASASATAAQEARTGAETAQAGAESAAQTAQAGADAVGLLREQIYNSYPGVEAEAGSIVSIKDGADGIPVKSLVVGIEPVQAGSGDPSPDNVRPITGWTGANVKRTGKNLLPPIADISALGVSYENNTDGSVSVNGTATGTFAPYFFNSDTRKFESGQYTLSGIDTSISGECYIQVTICNKSDDSIYSRRRITPSSPTLTFTLGSSQYIRDAFFRMSSGASANNATLHPQLEHGSTATDYEPYSASTYSITFPSSAGTVYGGSLDVTKGVLTVDRAQIASYAGETLPGEWISDRDVYAEGSTPTTGAQVVYELAEPITYQLTPTEVKTLLGSNNVWADTGDVQEMAYRADTKLYIDEVYEEYQDDLADYADALAALG